MATDLNEKLEDASDQIELLERFVLDNADLRRLEELAGPFNIFEALGVVAQETRHSNFLAWLLDPNQNHGLGELFLKRILMLTSSRAKADGIDRLSPIDVDVWDLSGTEVRREWQHIDICLVNEARQFICVIENKVYSSEHSDQLKRYREIVEVAYPDWNHHFVFLTATDDEPSDNEHYVRITYEDVCQTIEHVTKLRARALTNDVQIALSHYLTLVRRHIMPDLEVQDLCRRIYSKHRQALDLIFEHRPDMQSELHEALVAMVATEPQFIPDHSSKQWIRFLPENWDIPKLQRGEGWTPSHRMLLLQFYNRPDSLSLSLHLGPGNQGVRQEVFDLVKETGAPFRRSQKMRLTKWFLLYDKPFLRADDYEDADLDEMMTRVKSVWTEFKKRELPKLQSALEPVLRTGPTSPTT